MISTPQDDMVSVREAAKECKRTAETVRRWVWGGRLPARKLGNQLFIKRSDLTSVCREVGVNYEAKPKEAKPKADWFERAQALQERLKAMGLNFDDIDEVIHEMREERQRDIDHGLH